jgi:hypothetical protein
MCRHPKQRRKDIKQDCSAGENMLGVELTSPAPIRCQMQYETDIKGLTKPAISFLKENGHTSIVSLGCGQQVNRIDNHLRLMAGLNLNYYVGIDCSPYIEMASENLFMDPDDMTALLAQDHRRSPRRFWKAVNLFPGTFVEELAGVHCAIVVCQRVYPGFFWEDLIISMSPKLVLQEDLHGCERIKLRGKHYVRNWSKIRHFNLKPFRPWPVFPGEKNLILWRRRDFGDKQEESGKFRWLKRLCESYIG